MPRQRGGTISLTAFEAQWLCMVVDMAGDEAVDALPHVGKAPKRIADNPHEAWERILNKISAVVGSGSGEIG